MVIAHWVPNRIAWAGIRDHARGDREDDRVEREPANLCWSFPVTNGIPPIPVVKRGRVRSFQNLLYTNFNRLMGARAWMTYRNRRGRV
jgi:hypothetical protein